MDGMVTRQDGASPHLDCTPQQYICQIAIFSSYMDGGGTTQGKKRENRFACSCLGAVCRKEPPVARAGARRWRWGWGDELRRRWQKRAGTCWRVLAAFAMISGCSSSSKRTTAGMPCSTRSGGLARNVRWRRRSRRSDWQAGLRPWRVASGRCPPQPA